MGRQRFQPKAASERLPAISPDALQHDEVMVGLYIGAMKVAPAASDALTSTISFFGKSLLRPLGYDYLLSPIVNVTSACSRTYHVTLVKLTSEQSAVTVMFIRRNAKWCLCMIWLMTLGVLALSLIGQ